MVMGMSTDREANLTDATPTRNDKLTNVVLWGLVTAYVVASTLRAIFSNINTFPTILLLFPFTLIHGMKRYPWKGIAVFIVITLIVSGVMENLSILTGFPFGHYYYTDALGPKINLWTGVGFVLNYPFRPTNTAITDAVGHIWQTSDIYETTAISAIYTMIFISTLALAILLRRRLVQKDESAMRMTQ